MDTLVKSKWKQETLCDQTLHYTLVSGQSSLINMYVFAQIETLVIQEHILYSYCCSVSCFWDAI